MSQAQRNSIASPAAGLTLWCSNCGTSGELQVYNGTAWTNMVGGAAAVALVIGQSYLGGKIAYIDGTGFHGLVAANSDQGTSVAWWNGSNTSTGASGTAIGTGMANTIAIIASQDAGTYAAKICRDYQGGGYTDWFLPSRDELTHLYINRAAVGGFTGDNYWTSSENDLGGAWFRYFLSDNYQSAISKGTTYYVRAVRAF
jgi:hypothetical protein